MTHSCPSPEKCLFAGCDGICHPPMAAYAPTQARPTVALLAREIAWRRPIGAAMKMRDALATRRLLVAMP